jgi:peptidoglycan hydrolase-like protein with peptidoglycan-binding domain
LYFGRKGPWVFALQKFLNKLWFLNHVPTGYFGKLTKQALAKFQLQYWIRPADWSFTRKTSYELKKLLKRKGLFPKTSFVKISFAEKLSYPVSTKYVKIKNDLSYLKRGLGVWMRTYEVRILQKYLKYLWFYKWPITGFYGPLTKKAVTKFQLHYKLIRNENVVYAGYFGPKTRNLFKKLVLQKARK